MNLIEWLCYEDKKYLKRLAELVAVNGGMMIQHFGQSQPTTDNRYGRMGLEPHEAIELAFLHGMFEAFKSLANAGQLVEAQTLIMNEMKGGVSILIPDNATVQRLLASRPPVRRV